MWGVLDARRTGSSDLARVILDLPEFHHSRAAGRRTRRHAGAGGLLVLRRQDLEVRQSAQPTSLRCARVVDHSEVGTAALAGLRRHRPAGRLLSWHRGGRWRQTVRQRSPECPPASMPSNFIEAHL
jgi:hypothetical protein